MSTLNSTHDVNAESSGEPEKTVRIPVWSSVGDVAGVPQPVRFGVPVPRGRIADTALSARWVDCDGAAISDSVQARSLCFWPDGSVQWVLIEGLLDGNPNRHAASWVCLYEDQGFPDRAALVREQSGELCLETGEISGRFPKAGFAPLSDLTFRGEAVLGGPMEVSVTAQDGTEAIAFFEDARIEEAGPAVATVCLHGRVSRAEGVRVRLRLTCYRQSGLLRCELTVHNENRARHAGGIWDLGDPGSFRFQDLSLKLPLKTDDVRSLAYSLDPQNREFEPTNSLKLYQDSSGGTNWNSGVHVDENGAPTVEFSGFRCESDGQPRRGDRACPLFGIETESCQISVGLPEFWQNFPGAVELSREAIRLGIFAAEARGSHELQGGERKTRIVWIDVGPREASPEQLRWIHAPAVITPSPEWCAAAGLILRLDVEGSPRSQDFETILREALEGPKSIPANRERVDEYGWRNYGEIFADHEELYYEGAEPLVSHYNNQFDMVDGFLLQFLRTRDRRWFTLADALARHVMDIDIYHTQEDRAAYNGGLFWFTDHYLHAHTSTHRTYTRHNAPSDGRPYGGGPGAEHNFTTGLMRYHLLTGSDDAKAAVLELANWVIAMEDGTRTVFGLVDDGPTGLATAGKMVPGRGGGNSINALLDAWTLTREPRYLEFSEELIRRCVHPHQDIAKLDLLDVEKNWSYTVFLVSLAKYLDAKIEAEQLDEMYAYAQACLVRFGAWMAEHERPYFDQEERLEFPTEAWGAQELRKANVLRLAAAHADDPLHSRMLARADELGDRAWHDLMRFETRAHSRAVAIVMREGLYDCVARTNPPPRLPRVPLPSSVPDPVDFVPQKQRVRQMLKSPLGLATITVRLLSPFRWYRFLRKEAAVGL